MLENTDIECHLCGSLVKKHDDQYVYHMRVRACACVCGGGGLTNRSIKISTNFDCALQKCMLPTSELNARGWLKNKRY
jgi:hypothetical protein